MSFPIKGQLFTLKFIIRFFKTWTKNKKWVSDQTFCRCRQTCLSLIHCHDRGVSSKNTRTVWMQVCSSLLIEVLLGGYWRDLKLMAYDKLTIILYSNPFQLKIKILWKKCCWFCSLCSTYFSMNLKLLTSTELAKMLWCQIEVVLWYWSFQPLYSSASERSNWEFISLLGIPGWTLKWVPRQW